VGRRRITGVCILVATVVVLATAGLTGVTQVDGGREQAVA